MLPEYRLPNIEDDTDLQPRLVAAGVCQEAASHLWRFRIELDDEDGIIEWLTKHANHLYQQNVPFREKIKSDQGRQHLASCMRQWLGRRLEQTSPRIHARLPEGFVLGSSPLGTRW